MIRFLSLFSLVISLSLLSTVHAMAYDKKDLQQVKDNRQCPGCDLSAANLQGANLMDAILYHANLKGGPGLC